VRGLSALAHDPGPNEMVHVPALLERIARAVRQLTNQPITVDYPPTLALARAPEAHLARIVSSVTFALTRTLGGQDVALMGRRGASSEHVAIEVHCTLAKAGLAEASVWELLELECASMAATGCAASVKWSKQRVLVGFEVPS
jgi:predicted phage-related endonuclease